MASLVADEKRGGFDQDPHLLEVSTLLAENYQTVAESIADLMLQNQHALLQLECTEDETSNECVYRWILARGDQFFRRPMTVGEADQYFTLYQSIHTDSCTEVAMKWVITALLQSPHFLYRTELGRRLDVEQEDHSFVLNAYERANILSYLLWQSMPDETLFAKAQDLSLMQPEIVQSEIQRMMQDDKHQRTIHSFLDQWLGVQQVIEVTRDPIIYAALYFELREMMLNETRLFFNQLWNEQADFASLFTTHASWLNQSLANYYGVGSSWDQAQEVQEINTQLTDQVTTDQYRWTPLPANRMGGLLTHGSLLTIYAHADSSSPIHRGLFVRDRLLCEALPPPPENLDIELPEHSDDQDTRTLFEEHSSEPVCQGCHQFIDPLGFTFEAYDGIGRWRTEDHGFMIHDEGALIAQDLSSTPLYDVQDLAQHLAQSHTAKRCYVRQWMRFAQGEAEAVQSFGHESDDLRCQIDAMTQLSEELGGSLASPLEALAVQLATRIRVGEVEDVNMIHDEMDGQVPSTAERMAQSQHDLQQVSELTRCQGQGQGQGPSDDLYQTLTAGLTLSMTEDRWQTGFCHYFIVHNPTMEALEWSVSIQVEGTIKSAWGSNRDGDMGLVTFQGVSWNQEVPAGGEIEFGFCADL